MCIYLFTCVKTELTIWYWQKIEPHHYKPSYVDLMYETWINLDSNTLHFCIITTKLIRIGKSHSVLGTHIFAFQKPKPCLCYIRTQFLEFEIARKLFLLLNEIQNMYFVFPETLSVCRYMVCVCNLQFKSDQFHVCIFLASSSPSCYLDFRVESEAQLVKKANKNACNFFISFSQINVCRRISGTGRQDEKTTRRFAL